jgi:hypothetical protein
LRVAGSDRGTTDAVVDAFRAVAAQLPTPMLATLRNHLATRAAPAPVRIYWPKGGTAGSVSAPDARRPLGAETIGELVSLVESVLLARFRDLPASRTWLIDRSLRDVMVPFNERTASPSAIALPRGSTVAAPVPARKFVRLFLHWCEPKGAAYSTDLDLSVGLYGADWSYRGVCSYYQLQCEVDGKTIARSSGDLTSAPFPDGSSEFVDIDFSAALNTEVRYAVMVVNAYSGMAMNRLDRAFAGYMVREDSEGRHFDPRTVEMKFNLTGAQGIFVPLVFDFVASELHWLDAYSKGMPALNNVETSNRAIQTICPELVEYFRSSARMSMFELALLHAAARGHEVFLRGEPTVRFEREPDESANAFLSRLRDGSGARTETDVTRLTRRPDLTAALLRGDLELDARSARYVVFPEEVAGTIAASDWLR